MSFDTDPNEQACISGADFAMMCDEMNQLKQSNAELLETLEMLMLFAPNDHADVCQYERATWQEAKVAITKAKAKHKQ